MPINEKLKTLRTEIDSIDEELLLLFQRRMKLSDEIARIKKECELPILDATRETKVLARATKLIDSDLQEEGILFVRTLMELSKMRQQKQWKEAKQ